MHTQAIITAIENHSVLIIASAPAQERAEALQKRIHAVCGMLELARRLSGQQALVSFLRNHLEWLEQKAAGL